MVNRICVLLFCRSSILSRLCRIFVVGRRQRIRQSHQRAHQCHRKDARKRTQGEHLSDQCFLLSQHVLTEEKRRMTMLTWLMALEKFGIAAEAVGMWRFDAMLAHKEVCARIAGKAFDVCFIIISIYLLRFAARASLEDRLHSLAQMYDEVCRREWAQRSMRGKDQHVNRFASSRQLLCRRYHI